MWVPGTRILEAVRICGLPKTASASFYVGALCLVREFPGGNHPLHAAGVASSMPTGSRLTTGHTVCMPVMAFFLTANRHAGETFVTRKITRGLARIDAGLEECLFMGNLDAMRDWGHARDYVEMQWRMLQQDQPEDFVIATGRQESVRRFIELSAVALGWGFLQWDGEGIEEVGRRSDTGAVVVRIDQRYFRPTEVETLLGDPSRARERLGWTPITSLEEMVNEMIDHDREEARKEAFLRGKGFQVVGPRE